MLVVLMGVSGSGKSTIGRLLADRLGWRFLEADEFHPQANREKLAAGKPLTDADRAPWLEALNAGLIDAVGETGSVVLACSALKDKYRDRLDDGLPQVRWAHLVGDRKLLEGRLKDRVGHFSSPQILPSQFETLEPPEDATTVKVNRSPACVVEQVAQSLGVATVDPRVTDRVIARHLLLPNRHASASHSEPTEDLLLGEAFRLESIVSHGHSTPRDEWLSQPRPEWVLLLAGNARLLFEGSKNPYDVEAGDAWMIPAGKKHRVEWTDPEQQSVWLAIHFS